MTALDNFYLNQAEPLKSTYLALKEIILSQDKNITNEFKYGGPFFYYKQKMFCYLWFHKKYKQPYIGIVEGQHFNEPFLLKEERRRIKIMLLNQNEDLPLIEITAIIQKAINLYKSGIIKINTKK
jgi:hypothetical protein